MMLRSFPILAAGVLVLLSVTSAFAEKTTGETIDDTTIATKTKTALIGDKNVNADAINVEVYRGKVLLAGFVGSEEEKAAAIAATEKVEGVVEVLDGMVVQSGKRSFGRTLDDQTIQTKLKTDLLQEQGMEKGFGINTEVRQGEALLSGFVPDEKYKIKAGEIAQAVSGVTKVHNNIVVKD
jgi:hyperosmotically inducible protein